MQNTKGFLFVTYRLVNNLAAPAAKNVDFNKIGDIL